MRKRHKTSVPGIYYRLVDETKPDGPRRYIVWWEDANGVGHTETLPKGGTLEDARVRQAQLKVRKAQGDRLIPTRVTVEDLLNEWLESRRGTLAEKTWVSYEWAIRVHLIPKLGRRQVADVDADDVARMLQQLKAQGLRTASVQKIMAPFGQAMKLAVRRGWRPTNPVSLLFSHERPKGDQQEKRILGKADIPRLLEAASSERWRTLFMFLIFTGLRISEALALTWDDVDEGIRVRESKTKAGVRTVILMPTLRKQLAAWRLQQGHGLEHVFTNEKGNPIGYRMALRALKATEKRAGLPDLSLHELRHTFASILIGQGELPTFVSKQMGHADPAVTMTVYAKLWEEQESVEKATQRLEAAFGGMV